METLADLYEAGLARPKQGHLRWRDASGAWRAMSTEQVADTVARAARGLLGLGLRRGDRVGLIARNGERWALTDFALASTGLVNVPLYPTATPQQVRHVLDDSGSRVLVVEDREQLERLRPELRDAGLLRVVLLREEGEVPADVTGWTELIESAVAGGPEPERPRPEDLASLIYTSGTTGQPKGVMLSHRNLLSNALACAEAIDLSRVPRQVNLSLLPLCHIFQRLVDYFLWLRHAEMVYCPDPLEALEYFEQVRPTFFAAVPRLYEKVRAGFLTKVAHAAPRRRRLARWALKVGRRHFHAWYRDTACDGRPGLLLRAQHALADRLVLSKVRAVFGGRVDLCFSGGAALPPEVHEFLRAVGLNILPGYGLTEASPVLSTNRTGVMRLGSVGPALPGVELRTAEDGELLARGPNVMQGYWQRPEDTEAALREGWLHTGDLARIDERGFVFITGRKKELIVLSTGKNVSPQVVEDCLGHSPLVLQALVVGDDRKFVAALVAPNRDTLRAQARRQGLSFDSDEELLASPAARELVLDSFRAATAELAPYERPKKVAFLPRELSIEHGELTPTLKYRRRRVLENWSELLSELYDEPAAAGEEVR
jgi:long-chain acyl-CoA synthetase